MLSISASLQPAMRVCAVTFVTLAMCVHGRRRVTYMSLLPEHSHHSKKYLPHHEPNDLLT